MNLTAATSAQGKAEAEKLSTITEKQVATELQKKAEGRYERLRRKYNHFKHKAMCLLKQLSFVPWLRDYG